VNNDSGDTLVGQLPRLPKAPIDPFADTVVPAEPAAPRPKPPTRRTEAHTSAVRPPSPSAIYSFRIGALKEPIRLDRPVRVGRRPASSRIQVGATPRLVRVESPRHEVSATHLELRQTGSTVVVTDLRSTNGTVVLVPGSTPRKLLQGESVVVSPGTLVDIGDENILQILPLERLA